MRSAVLLLAAALAGCDRGIPVEHFAGTTPAFDPVAFFTGHTHSWGVIENRDGAPTDTVETDCVGTRDGDVLHMRQTLTLGDGTVQHRDWTMRRQGGGRFTATASDMAGDAMGQAAGRVFHWTWDLQTRPGQSWRNVTFEQWMYAMPGGSMVNRTVVTKFGVRLAEVTEQFAPLPDGHGP